MMKVEIEDARNELAAIQSAMKELEDFQATLSTAVTTFKGMTATAEIGPKMAEILEPMNVVVAQAIEAAQTANTNLVRLIDAQENLLSISAAGLAD